MSRQATQAEQEAPAEQAAPPERQLPRNTGGPGQHRSRPAQWDPASFQAVVRQFAQPIEITDTAEPQHDPSRRLTRLLRLRDVRCAGPGCSVPAARCDRDHLTPYGAPGGHTAAWNLRHLSRRCHRAKHHGWTLTVHPDGNASWLSPLGRTYNRPSPHDPPHPTRWAHEGTAAGWLVDARAIQTTTEADWDWGHDGGPLASNPSTSNPNASDPNSSDPNSSDRAGRGLVDGLPGQGQAGDPPPF